MLAYIFVIFYIFYFWPHTRIEAVCGLELKLVDTVQSESENISISQYR